MRIPATCRTDGETVDRICHAAVRHRAIGRTDWLVTPCSSTAIASLCGLRGRGGVVADDIVEIFPPTGAEYDWVGPIESDGCSITQTGCGGTASIISTKADRVNFSPSDEMFKARNRLRFHSSPA